MPTFLASNRPAVPELHVFEQEGGWHWGITVPRVAGSGFKLVAFSKSSFSLEAAARADGSHALAHLADKAHTMDLPLTPLVTDFQQE
ncbi:hypothetical protein CIC12_23450 [Burkholderia sp. SG-MS1]|uniref:hypothetical protein n=1 Tax=Paraburkholderia sp. SG-MS1 TaxID=2023741 RepID=UPI00144770C3|nr:hypothetical protein [Paraburkholderia sp. SG-MS1]NKJ49633.1 hypothetical protein [Paraburkholderia sp. SG-MS1]